VNEPAQYFQQWGGFPREEYIPKGCRESVRHLLDLRVKLADAREAEQEARANIAKADQQSIDATVQALARGELASVDNRPVSEAQAVHYQAVTNLRALNGAMEIAEREVANAYARHAGDAKRLASNAVEAARANYRQAIDTVAQCRRDYHDALDTVRFADQASLSLHDSKRGPVLNHIGQRVGDSPQELGKLRNEVDLPIAQRPTDQKSTMF
jgi:hypothetical protein